MGPREPFPACRPETCRYTRPERLALAIVAAFLIRWCHPNLRALAAQKLPLVRPQRSNTTENILSGIEARCGTSAISTSPCQSRHTVTNYFSSLIGTRDALTPELLFNHIVGARKHRRRHGEAKRFRRLEIGHELVLGRRLHRQVGCLLALEDAIDVAGSAPVGVGRIGSVRGQATLSNEDTKRKYSRQPVTSRKRNDDRAAYE